MKNLTTAERHDRELVLTRTFNCSPKILFEAWTTPALFRRWWVPKSLGMVLLACDLDARTGGTYRLKFGPESAPMEFFGKYLEVTPHSRIVWTNEEGGEAGPVTTVTFEAKGDKTLQVMRELFPSKEALDAAIASGATMGNMDEQFGQLDEVLGVG